MFSELLEHKIMISARHPHHQFACSASSITSAAFLGVIGSCSSLLLSCSIPNDVLSQRAEQVSPRMHRMCIIPLKFSTHWVPSPSINESDPDHVNDILLQFEMRSCRRPKTPKARGCNAGGIQKITIENLERSSGTLVRVLKSESL